MLGLLFLILLPFAVFGIDGSGSDDLASGGTDDPDGDDGAADPFTANSGGAGDDSLTGQAGADVLQGAEGVDTITGQGDEDLLSGQDGNDLLEGGPGGDVLSGGRDQDVLLGQEDGDLLLGNAGSDLLDGGRGADLLVDYSGSDTLVGDIGNDTLVAIDLSDKITRADVWPEAAGAPDSAGFEAELAARFATVLTPVQIAQVSTDLQGGDVAPDAPDTLDGGGGNDVLLGDDGDIMTGGRGADQFVVYTDPAAALTNDPVRITDLDPRTDRLSISVEDDGQGALTFALDPFGTGTAISYNGDLIAVIADRMPATLQGFLSTITVEPRADL